MHDSESVGVFMLLIIFVLGAFLIGTCIGSHNTVSYTEVIQHGAAHYDPVTAKFTWNASATMPTLNPGAQKP